MNADQTELDKFSALAHRWWDPTSEFKPLHAINPLRLDWINQHIGLEGKRVLDVGCGGGILAESMAKMGAKTKGIDLSKKALQVAELHSLETSVPVDYELISAEDLAQEQAGQFDVVTCMEMLEHVPDPASVVRACSNLVKPGGWVFFSTLNRNPKSFLFAVVLVVQTVKYVSHQADQYSLSFQSGLQVAVSCALCLGLVASVST